MAKIVKIEYKYDDLGRLVNKRVIEISSNHDCPEPEHSSTERIMNEAYLDYLLSNSWD